MLIPGDIHITLDENRRLKLPSVVLSNYDQSGGREVVLRFWSEGCLGILPKSVWTELCAAKGYDKVDSMKSMEDRLEMQYYFGNTKLDEISAQGRLTIPDYLCECAGLVCGQGVVLVSGGRFLNVWNPQRLAELKARFEERDRQKREEYLAKLTHSQ